MPGTVSNGNGAFNDNDYDVSFPFLDYDGLGYNLNQTVNLPPNGAGASTATSRINLINQPPCEVGTCTWDNSYNAGIPNLNSGLAYFLIQPSAKGVYTAANCGSPRVMGTKTINFGYTASPRVSASYYLSAATKPAGAQCLNSGPTVCPLWSACVAATMTAIGPISYPGYTTGTTDSVYILTSATGTRYYSDVNGGQGSVQITGVGTGDGGDFSVSPLRTRNQPACDALRACAILSADLVLCMSCVSAVHDEP